MPLTDARVAARVLATLTPDEQRACVVYLAATLIESGCEVTTPRGTFTSPCNGRLLFVDLDPAANWGHACAYFCVDDASPAVHRHNAQFPPFGVTGSDGRRWTWRAVHRAAAVPDAFVVHEHSADAGRPGSSR
jgi:hypothetical protein